MSIQRTTGGRDFADSIGLEHKSGNPNHTMIRRWWWFASIDFGRGIVADSILLKAFTDSVASFTFAREVLEKHNFANIDSENFTSRFAINIGCSTSGTSKHLKMKLISQSILTVNNVQAFRGYLDHFVPKWVQVRYFGADRSATSEKTSFFEPSFNWPFL